MKNIAKVNDLDGYKEILTMKDGHWRVYGGYGNRLIAEVKVEKGKHFRRYSGQEEWEYVDAAKEVAEKFFEYRAKEQEKKISMLSRLRMFLRI